MNEIVSQENERKLLRKVVLDNYILTAPHGKPWRFSDGILQKAYNRTALFSKENSADFSTSVFLPEQLT